MPVLTAAEGSVHVFTFKEGLLSKIAHDLRLRVERFEIHIDPPAMRATFQPASLRVETAMKDGREHRGALSDKDKATIEENLRNDVLHTARFREVRFEGSFEPAAGEGRWQITGKLTLHGTTRELTTVARRDGDKIRAELTLHQPDYGITPYRAMLGTLKVQPDVRVVVDLPGSLGD